MSTLNPFDLLGDDDTGDMNQLMAAVEQKAAPKKEDDAPAKPAAKGAALQLPLTLSPPSPCWFHLWSIFATCPAKTSRKGGRDPSS